MVVATFARDEDNAIVSVDSRLKLALRVAAHGWSRQEDHVFSTPGRYLQGRVTKRFRPGFSVSSLERVFRR
jgi:hypothetical protein